MGRISRWREWIHHQEQCWQRFGPRASKASSFTHLCIDQAQPTQETSQEHLANTRTLIALTDQRFLRFFFGAPSRGADRLLFPPVFAFFSMRTFHAVWSAPLSTSSFAAARRICVCPIFPQPPGIGKKISGASWANAACCSSVSIRFPYPCACEASEANFLPPTRKAGNPA
jgi:hypothetical protein